MKITGGCLCGAVRFESAAPPMVTRHCWCRLCQYLGAGSGTVNACFKTDGFTIMGTTRDYASIADSGNVMHRQFCATCGTPLFSTLESAITLERTNVQVTPAATHLAFRVVR